MYYSEMHYIEEIMEEILCLKKNASEFSAHSEWTKEKLDIIVDMVNDVKDEKKNPVISFIRDTIKEMMENGSLQLFNELSNRFGIEFDKEKALLNSIKYKNITVRYVRQKEELANYIIAKSLLTKEIAYGILSSEKGKKTIMETVITAIKDNNSSVLTTVFNYLYLYLDYHEKEVLLPTEVEKTLQEHAVNEIKKHQKSFGPGCWSSTVSKLESTLSVFTFFNKADILCTEAKDLPFMALALVRLGQKKKIFKNIIKEKVISMRNSRWGYQYLQEYFEEALNCLALT